MLSRAFISREEIAIGCKLLAWAENYLMGNEEKIMRPYGPRTVCPFAEASVRKNALYMVFHSELTGEDIEPILSLLVDYINPFIVQDSTKEKSHKALLAVFPRIGPEHYGSLDRVHELIKDRMVANGLMCGQFHPQCRTPAIHNPAWRDVSVPPYPLIAIRHMVVHDILFLHDKKQWFLHYHLRYGAKYDRPGALGGRNAHLVPIYNKAKCKFLCVGSA
jgi:hypothetical protein